jgi:hypothetical protein
MPRLGKTRRKSRSRARARSRARGGSSYAGSFPFAGHNYSLTRANKDKPLSRFPNIENPQGQIVPNANYYHPNNVDAARYRDDRARIYGRGN